MNGRIELNSNDVQEIVIECIDRIENVQMALNLPICLNIEKTKEQLHEGFFKIESFIMRRTGRYRLDYASFKPPSTIVLNSQILTCEKDLNTIGIYPSLVRYCITREVLKVDDYVGGNIMLNKTREHILRDHTDKLEKGMQIVIINEGEDYIKDLEDLAYLWANQYIEMVNNYKAYVVLRHHKLPKLNLIWNLLKDELFSPSIFTCLENHLGTSGVFNIITNMIGRYCLIEALNESKKILDENVSKYVI